MNEAQFCCYNINGHGESQRAGTRMPKNRCTKQENVPSVFVCRVCVCVRGG